LKRRREKTEGLVEYQGQTGKVKRAGERQQNLQSNQGKTGLCPTKSEGARTGRGGKKMNQEILKLGSCLVGQVLAEKLRRGRGSGANHLFGCGGKAVKKALYKVFRGKDEKDKQNL